MAGKKYKMYIALSLFLYHWKIHNKVVHYDMLIMLFFCGSILKHLQIQYYVNIICKRIH